MVLKYAEKVANLFQNNGFKKGDTVAILVDNCPEYTCIWLGLSKIGIISGLINTRITGDSLLYAITVIQSKAIIFGDNFKDQIVSIQNKLENVSLYQLTLEGDINSMDVRGPLNGISDSSTETHVCNFNDPVMYIFTSGTTGLPKPAIITNQKYLQIVTAMRAFIGFKPDDTIYNCLPLYHSSGTLLCNGQYLLGGNTIVMRKKFSASRYFADCEQYKCTIGFYVGEMCRYILGTSPENDIKPTKLRALTGNGLKGNVWKEFVSRFKVKQIIEFYAATEGNMGYVNSDNTIGSCGFVPVYIQHLQARIKCNEETGEPIRDAKGYCIRCKSDEPGLQIGVIKESLPISLFLGYTNKKETQKKILRNVFKNGDMYFNTGDILVMNKFGYLYFVDRTGDNFRWKGENVSTYDVEDAISKVIELNDAVVFGVKVPRTEGCAGMSVIVPHDNFDVDLFNERLKNRLPSYAIPVFLRVVEKVPVTGNFKLQKYQFRQEGYNPNVIRDPLYLYDAKLGKYIYLTSSVYQSILKEELNL
ncbi:hypothetical protein RI129_002148 [Pyrocoelia pectoralis]|uniref:Long-chain-fatty-acid--CoA ligase n=1 Tax=Pyrocoelia pectoralis TaxID=417401 RepID=A0AAN7ZSR8_9COLE